jgi:SOS response regulatory protein OraA/RecX
MKKEAYEYLFNEAIKYLGRYPATKKKINEYLQKKITNKKIYQKAVFPEGINKNLLIENIVSKLDDLKIIDENNYLESLFNYYLQSLFSIRKIKNKLFLKGFDQNKIDEYINYQLQKNPEIEINILKKYIAKKKLNKLDNYDLKKKLYQQSFSERSIFIVIKD